MLEVEEISQEEVQRNVFQLNSEKISKKVVDRIKMVMDSSGTLAYIAAAQAIVDHIR